MRIIVEANLNQEIRQVILTLKDIGMLERSRLKHSLPGDPAIEDLKRHSREGHFTYQDEEAAKEAVTRVYNAEIYAPMIRAISEYTEDTARLFEGLRGRGYEAWGFKFLDSYTFLPTLYGSGGSYNAARGEVTIKLIDNPEKNRRTPLHEMVHIAIEEAIIQRYHIDADTKEYIVDRFMIDHFGDVFPQYRMQQRTEKADPRVKNLLQPPAGQRKSGYDWRNFGRDMDRTLSRGTAPIDRV